MSITRLEKFIYTPQSILASSTGTKPIAVRGQLPLENRLNHIA